MGKLNIKPFDHEIEAQQVYQDRSVFGIVMLSLSVSVLTQTFLAGVVNMDAFSKEIKIWVEVGLPHLFGNAFRSIVFLVTDIDFTFKQIEKVQKFLLKYPIGHGTVNDWEQQPPSAAEAAVQAAPAAAQHGEYLALQVQRASLVCGCLCSVVCLRRWPYHEHRHGFRLRGASRHLVHRRCRT